MLSHLNTAFEKEMLTQREFRFEPVENSWSGSGRFESNSSMGMTHLIVHNFQEWVPVENIEADLVFIIGRSNIPVIKLFLNCFERYCKNVLNERRCRCLRKRPPPLSKFLSRALFIGEVANERETNTWSVVDCVHSEIEFVDDQILETRIVRQLTTHFKEVIQLVPIRPAARKQLSTSFEHEPRFIIH